MVFTELLNQFGNNHVSLAFLKGDGLEVVFFGPILLPVVFFLLFIISRKGFKPKGVNSSWAYIIFSTIISTAAGFAVLSLIAP